MKHWLMLGLFSAALVSPAPTQSGNSQSLSNSRFFIEYDATNGEAVLIAEADSNAALSSVLVSDQAGLPVFLVRGAAGVVAGLTGIKVESAKRSLEETLASVPPGRYQLLGRTSSGVVESGLVSLSHELPPVPAILAPIDGQLAVESTGLVVAWVEDPNSVAYRVVIEQDENDGLIAIVRPGKGSLTIPDGILAPHRRIRVEVAAIAANGNVTINEIECQTR